jgi:hypothetical protein
MFNPKKKTNKPFSHGMHSKLPTLDRGWDLTISIELLHITAFFGFLFQIEPVFHCWPGKQSGVETLQ